MGKRWIPLGEWGVLLLMVLSVLWKGGKGLEAVWLLAALAFVLTFLTWRMKFQERQAAMLSIAPNVWVTGLLFILWTILSYLFSQTRNYGLDEVFATAALIFLFFWVIRMRAGGFLSMFPRSLARTITSVTVIAVIIGVCVYTLQPVNRFVGTFFDWRFHTDYWPNAWAQYLLLAWPLFGMALMDHTQKKSVQRGLIVILGLVIGALLLSYSRGAILAFTGQIVLITLLFASHHLWNATRPPSHVYRLILSSIFTVATVASLFFVSSNALRSMQFDVQSVAEKATFTAAEGTSSVNERSQFWKQAMDFTRQRSLVGWGPYSFRFIQTASMQDVLATSDHPHNAVLKLSAERGIPAAILFLLLCGFVITSGLISIVRRGDIRALFLLTTLAGVAAHNLIDYNLQFVGIALPVTLAAALLMEQPRSVLRPSGTHPWELKLRRLLSRLESAFVLILFALLVWEGAHLGLSSLGRHAEAAGNASEAFRWYGASEHAGFSRDLHLSVAQLSLRSRAYGQAERALDAYRLRNEEDVRVWKLIGELHLRTGNYDRAADALAIAMKRGTFTDLSITRLFIEALRRSSSDASLKEKEEELAKIFLRFAEAIEQNSHYIALSQNPEELMAIARLLEALYPESNMNYVSIAQSAQDHALEERKMYASRAPGILW